MRCLAHGCFYNASSTVPLCFHLLQPVPSSAPCLQVTKASRVSCFDRETGADAESCAARGCYWFFFQHFACLFQHFEGSVANFRSDTCKVRCDFTKTCLFTTIVISLVHAPPPSACVFSHLTIGCFPAGSIYSVSERLQKVS